MLNIIYIYIHIHTCWFWTHVTCTYQYMPSLNIKKPKFGISSSCKVEPRTVGPVGSRRIVRPKPQGQRGLQFPRVGLNLFGKSWKAACVAWFAWQVALVATWCYLMQLLFFDVLRDFVFLLCVCKFHYFRGKTSSKLLVKHVSGRGLKRLSECLAHGMSPYVSIRFDWSTGLQSCYIAVQQLRQFLTHFVVTTCAIDTYSADFRVSSEFCKARAGTCWGKKGSACSVCCSNTFKHLQTPGKTCWCGIYMHLWY